MPYPESLVREIAARHGLRGEVSLLPRGGMVNEAWAIGDGHVLRIVLQDQDEECDVEAERESLVVPALVEAGLLTPSLVAYDKSFAPRPYSVYERAKGEVLGFTKLPHSHFLPAFERLGRELARLHTIEVGETVRGCLRKERGSHLDRWTSKSLEAGAISQAEADEVLAFGARLAEIGGDARRERLIHNDIHPWNVMADASTGVLTAIIDWGDASFGDPAQDFAVMPLPCIEPMLDAYFDESGGGVEDREAFTARALFAGLNAALWEIRATEIMTPERHWWRMPPGGWNEMKSLVATYWPSLR